MNCQYCGKIFTSDYNLRRYEDEYCPDRDNDGEGCSPPKKSRDADEASISSNESMGTHASHDDDNEDTEKHRSTGHIKWANLHSDEPTVQSIVKETTAMEN